MTQHDHHISEREIDTKIEKLEATNRALLDALDLVVSIDMIQSSANLEKDRRSILIAASEQLKRVSPFSAVGFFFNDAVTNAIKLEYCFPESEIAAVKEHAKMVLNAAMQEWLFNHNRIMHVPGLQPNTLAMFYPLVTRTQRFGFFFGFIAEEKAPSTEIAHHLLRFIFNNASNLLEKKELVRNLTEHREHLKDLVKQRTKALERQAKDLVAAKNKAEEQTEILHRQATDLIAARETALERRIHILITFLTLIIIFAGSVANVLLGMNMWATIITAASFIIVVIFFIIARHEKHYQWSIVPLFIISVVLLSTVWFLNAGYDGNIINLMFVYFMGMYTIIQKKYKTIVFLTFLTMFSSLVVIQYSFPELVIPYDNKEQRFVDLLAGNILYFFFIYFIINIIIKSYTAENNEVAVMNEQLKNKNKEIIENNLKIQESEERYRTLIDNSTDLIQSVAPDGRFLFVNPNWLHTLGYNEEEVPGLNLFKIIHHDSVPHRQPLFEKILRGATVPHMEVTFIAKDGRPIFLEGSAVPRLLDGNVIATQSFFHDITERKLVGETLRLSERKYKNIFNFAPVGIYQSSPDGRFITVNNELAKILGYDSPDEMMSLDMANDVYFDKEERAALIAQFEPEGSVADLEIRWKNKNGVPVWIQLNSRAVKGADGKTLHFEGFVRDIGERKRAEESLHESEERFRRVVEHIKDALMIDDVSGKIVYANDQFLRLFGFERKNLKQLKFEDYVAPEWQAELRERHNRRIRGESAPIQFEYEGIRTDGKRIWLEVDVVLLFDDNGRTIGTQSAIRDITARKHAENQLRNNEERLRLAMSAANQGLFDIDATTGNTVTNPIYNQNLGYQPGELRETFAKWLKRTHPDDRQKVLAGYKKYFSNQQDENSVEIRQQTKSGEWKWFFTIGKAIEFDKDGRPTRIIGFQTDISERKRAEESLRESESEVRKLNEVLEQKVEERTRELEEMNKQLESFSYSISHDLRAPLRAINSFTKFLIEDENKRLSAEGRRHTSIIRKNTERMSRLIDDLLEFSRASRKEMYKVNFNIEQLAKQTLDGLLEVEPDRTIESTILPLPNAYGDPSLIRQVLVNFLSNAIKFSKKRADTKIEIGCLESPVDGAASATTRREENIYYVKDNGAGFDMKYVDKLFGVFHRLHKEEEYEGTGVGLAIVQRIIQRHGGRVWVHSEVDNGATFYFALSNSLNM